MPSESIYPKNIFRRPHNLYSLCAEISFGIAHSAIRLLNIDSTNHRKFQICTIGKSIIYGKNNKDIAASWPLHLTPAAKCFSIHSWAVSAYPCLPLVLLTVAICVAKRVYRNKRGGYIIGFCATAVFLAIVIGAWLFKMITHYMEAHTIWLPPSDFGSSLAYIWLWFCISAVMLCAWLAGTPPKPEPKLQESA